MSRRKARELALQVLFSIDLGHGDPETAMFQAFAREAMEDEQSAVALGEKDAQFARDLVQGTLERLEEIDRLIVSYAREWTVARMPGVDRNILRMAIYEINHRDDVPDGAAVDEAVELAKLYSTPDSGKFVNGILGSVIRGLRQGAVRAEPPFADV